MSRSCASQSKATPRDYSKMAVLTPRNDEDLVVGTAVAILAMYEVDSNLSDLLRSRVTKVRPRPFSASFADG